MLSYLCRPQRSHAVFRPPSSVQRRSDVRAVVRLRPNLRSCDFTVRFVNDNPVSIAPTIQASADAHFHCAESPWLACGRPGHPARHPFLNTGKLRTITLVYPEDVDLSPNCLSVFEPLGAALLGRQLGDVVECRDGRGVRKLLISEIFFQPEQAGMHHL